MCRTTSRDGRQTSGRNRRAPTQYQEPVQAAPAAPSQDDKLEQLQKLGELKTAGVLTEAEFEAQKAKILAG